MGGEGLRPLRWGRDSKGGQGQACIQCHITLRLLGDTLQHGVQRQVLHWAGVGAAFVELAPQVHKGVEAVWQGQVLEHRGTDSA